MKIFPCASGLSPTFESFSHHSSLRKYREQNENWQNQEQIWKLAALLAAVGQRCKPLGSQKKGLLTMQSLPLHTQPSPPAGGAVSSQALLWLQQRQEKGHALLPLRLCAGEGCTSPTSRCCGHPCSSPPSPWGLAALAGWLLWETWFLTPSTAVLHPLCAFEKIWVRSAKASYRTTGLSNRAAGLNTFKSFFVEVQRFAFAQIFTAFPCVILLSSSINNPIVSQTDYLPPEGPDTWVEGKQKLLVRVRHLYLFCRSGEIAKRTWCNSGVPNKERKNAFLTCLQLGCQWELMLFWAIL